MEGISQTNHCFISLPTETLLYCLWVRNSECGLRNDSPRLWIGAPTVSALVEEAEALLTALPQQKGKLVSNDFSLSSSSDCANTSFILISLQVAPVFWRSKSPFYLSAFRWTTLSFLLCETLWCRKRSCLGKWVQRGLREVTLVALMDGFSKELRRRSVWTLILQLSISFSVLNLPQGFSCSLLGYSPPIIRMDSVSLLTSALSLSLLSQGKRGLVSKSSLGLLVYFPAFFNSTPCLPHSSLLFHSSCQIAWLLAQSGWLYRPAGRWRFWLLFPSVVLCPGGMEINKERARRCQKTTGISCSSKKIKQLSHSWYVNQHPVDLKPPEFCLCYCQQRKWKGKPIN